MAPEEFADEAKCARKSDVYVFGVTVCEGHSRSLRSARAAATISM
jgi:hypothetical protein